MSASSAAVARGCPTPGKVAFPDRETAKGALELARRLRGQGITKVRRRGGVERRVYECRCGRFHLTSRANWRD